MNEASDPLAAERDFFTALVEAGLEALDWALADDFLLIDVMSGAEITTVDRLGIGFPFLGSSPNRMERISGRP